MVQGHRPSHASSSTSLKQLVKRIGSIVSLSGIRQNSIVIAASPDTSTNAALQPWRWNQLWKSPLAFQAILITITIPENDQSTFMENHHDQKHYWPPG